MPGTAAVPPSGAAGALGGGSGLPAVPAPAVVVTDGEPEGVGEPEDDGEDDGEDEGEDDPEPVADGVADGVVVGDTVGPALAVGVTVEVGNGTTGFPFRAAVMYWVQMAVGNEPPLTRPPPPTPYRDLRVCPSGPLRNSETAVESCGV